MRTAIDLRKQRAIAQRRDDAATPPDKDTVGRYKNRQPEADAPK
jgi:hypothetical protein